MFNDITITWPPTRNRKTEKTANLDDTRVIIGYHRSAHQISAIFADMPGETTKEPDLGYITLQVLDDCSLAYGDVIVEVEPIERCGIMTLLVHDFWSRHGQTEYLNPQGHNCFVVKPYGEIISQA